MREELPADVREEAVAVARRIGNAEEAESVLTGLLEPYGFVPRIREDDSGPVLICYPADWRQDEEVHVNAIDDIDRAVELPLSGPADEEWERIVERNRQIVDRVTERYGEVHGANVRAFATFMNNHRARPIDHASDGDVDEFLTEYYPRNVWPSESEAAVVEKSIELARSLAEESL